MPNRTRPYREALLEALADPVEASYYLNAALEDSPEMFRKACLNVIQARQVAKVARRSGVTRENLYRSFSAAGNPTLETLQSVLRALGLQIGIQPQPAPIRSLAVQPRKSASVRKTRKRHAAA